MAKLLTHPAMTSDETIRYDLKRSLIERGVAKPAGLTWGDFKKAGDLLLKDDEPLAFVEYGIRQGGLGAIERDDDEYSAGVGIREI